ncbi:hypothetical protein Bca101_033398 [Brassica carinata]
MEGPETHEKHMDPIKVKIRLIILFPYQSDQVEGHGLKSSVVDKTVVVKGFSGVCRPCYEVGSPGSKFLETIWRSERVVTGEGFAVIVLYGSEIVLSFYWSLAGFRSHIDGLLCGGAIYSGHGFFLVLVDGVCQDLVCGVRTLDGISLWRHLLATKQWFRSTPLLLRGGDHSLACRWLSLGTRVSACKSCWSFWRFPLVEFQDSILCLAYSCLWFLVPVVWLVVIGSVCALVLRLFCRACTLWVLRNGRLIVVALDLNISFFASDMQFLIPDFWL